MKQNFYFKNFGSFKEIVNFIYLFLLNKKLSKMKSVIIEMNSVLFTSVTRGA